MLKESLQEIKIAFLLLLMMSFLTGVLYPWAVTLAAQLICPWQANGSLLQKNGQIIGSKLIGQSFKSLGYFWGRPRTALSFANNIVLSAGSNWGPLDPRFLQAVKERASLLRQFPTQYPFVPVDLVTASGSGLDPEISPLAAYYQIPRIAKIRQAPPLQVQALINQMILHRTFGFLGEPRVNVLQLNLALDYFFPLKVSDERKTT